MKSKFYFTLFISMNLSAQDLNEKKILAEEASLQITNSTTTHYSETLHDIFKYGYLLSDSSKEALSQKGFIFNKKLLLIGGLMTKLLKLISITFISPL